MSVSRLYRMITNAGHIIEALASSGMRVEVGDDFARYRNLRNTCRDGSGMPPMFDCGRSFVDHTNGFWICGFDDDHALVHTQAVRLVDIGGKTLGRHLDDHRHMYIPPDSTPDPTATFFRGPEALNHVSGLIAYCGDFWMTPRGLGGPRSLGATNLLARLVFEVLCENWAPDYAFAFVPKQLGSKGAHLRYGYTNCELGRWVGPDDVITHEEYMITMSTAEIRNVVSRDAVQAFGAKSTHAPASHEERKSAQS